MEYLLWYLRIKWICLSLLTQLTKCQHNAQSVCIRRREKKSKQKRTQRKLPSRSISYCWQWMLWHCTVYERRKKNSLTTAAISFHIDKTLNCLLLFSSLFFFFRSTNEPNRISSLEHSIVTLCECACVCVCVELDSSCASHCSSILTNFVSCCPWQRTYATHSISFLCFCVQLNDYGQHERTEHFRFRRRKCSTISKTFRRQLFDRRRRW